MIGRLDGARREQARVIAALVAVTAIRLAMAARMPLSPDEAYYWVWSRAPAAGYLDHPPMVALWIRAGTVLAGDGAFGIRLLGPAAAVVGTWVIWRTGEDLFPHRGVGARAAVLLNATLLFNAGAVTATPDTPLLLFWTLTFWAVLRAWRTGRGVWWLAAGAAFGAAMASKYTAVLLAPGLSLWILLDSGRRRWLRTPWPWLGVAVGAAIFAPVVWWNAAHGWASFLKQGGRVADRDSSRAATFLGELVLGQVGLLTPLVAAMAAAGLVVAVRRWREPEWGFLAAATVPPLLVFVQHATGDRVQANWPAILAPGAVIAAAALDRAARWVRPAAALGAVIAVAVLIQASLAPLRLPRRWDPTLARLAGWDVFARDAATAAAGTGAIVADNYGTAALLAHAAPGVPVLGAERRWALFDLPAPPPGPWLLVRSMRRVEAPDADWDSAVPVGTIVRTRDGVVAETYGLYRVTGPHLPVVRLPKGSS